LVEKQLPAKLVRENTTKRVAGEQHQLTQILKKREHRRAKRVEESNHCPL
jgi:hypothetical protein